MSNEGSIQTPAGWLVRALLSYGLDLEEIEAVIGMPIHTDILQELILPTETYRALFEWAGEATGNPSLGLHIAERTDNRELGVINYLAEHSPTLGALFQNLATYSKVHSRDADFSLCVEKDEAIFEMRPVRLGGAEPRQDTIFTIALIVFGIRRITNSDWRPLRCEFAMPAPQDRHEMVRVLGCDIEFLQVSNTIVVALEDLEWNIPDADPILFSILRKQADEVLIAQGDDRELVQRLRLLIASNLTDASFCMEQAAELLHMSVRKLHRELAARTTSFRELRDSVVHESAKSALVNSDIPITQIAHRVGYSETSAFSRAFKRIEGVSPNTYRNKAR